MMGVWRIYSPVKDSPEWSARALSEIISHYRGVDLPDDHPVKVTDLQGGRRDPGASRTNVRPRTDGESPIPKGATDQDVSFSAVPGLMTVHVVGDGKALTFKDSPESNALCDLAVLHNLTAICLYFGTTAHMSGPVDMYDKQPHTLTTRMVVNDTLDESDGPMNVFEACAMYRFYYKCVKEPAWEAPSGNGKPP